MQTGVLDLTPTPESLFIKEKNKVVRKNAREKKKKGTTAHNHTPDGTADSEQYEAELAQKDVESGSSHHRRKQRRLNRFQ